MYPMKEDKSKKLSTEPYKGVRDFFPVDMAREKEVFRIWKNIVEKYGYEEYNASVLEPAELYKAKSGEEIVNEQTYTFTDRGDREVTLRPEMTPSVARMIAGRRRELTFPLRWYSIPNLFRYEQPQRGRVREHWQLNVDIFGVSSILADVEIINIAYDIVRNYGLKETDFEIRLNNRKIMNYITHDIFNLDDDSAYRLSKLIDKKDKVSKESFEEGAGIILGDKKDLFMSLMNSQNFEDFTDKLQQTKEEHEGIKELREIMSKLEMLGITNVRFDQTLMRGFDYYTGSVFEIFDLNPKNRRSIFGGGRYDDLLSLFGNDKIPAVGFGAGDVIALDVMDTYGYTFPQLKSDDYGICLIGIHNAPFAMDLAEKMRGEGKKVTIDFSEKKVGDQISNMEKRGINKVICIGEEEVKTGTYKIKDLISGIEKNSTDIL